MAESSKHKPTERVLELLEIIGENPEGLTLTQISKGLSIPKSTVYSILQTLAERNYLKAEAGTGRFRLEYMVYGLGQKYIKYFSFMEFVQEELDRLVEVCKETCHYSILKGGDILYLKKKESPQPISMTSMIGNTMPAYATGLGKALLCDCSKEELEALYNGKLEALTENTITDLDMLYEQLKEIRKSNFAYEKEESNKYVQCVAVPIRKNGVVISAVSIAVPVFRYTAKLEETMKEELMKTKKHLEDIFSKGDFAHH